jgi:hypothetical protein
MTDRSLAGWQLNLRCGDSRRGRQDLRLTLISVCVQDGKRFRIMFLPCGIISGLKMTVWKVRVRQLNFDPVEHVRSWKICAQREAVEQSFGLVENRCIVVH